MNKIYIFEYHSQLLDLWRRESLKGLSILHLDAHCDLRGLLIDRQRNAAYKICIGSRIDDGNFLTFALLEGRLRAIRWVHDQWGGRENDTFTVRYETDALAIPYKLLHRLLKVKGFQVEYEVIKYEEWQGLNEGEHLDIDWDFFASYRKPKTILRTQIEKFLDQKLNRIPTYTYLCYSPSTSYSSREEFIDFTSVLAKKFNAELINLNPIKS